MFLSFDCSLLPHFRAVLHKITFILNFKGYNFGSINFFLKRLVAALKFGLIKAAFFYVGGHFFDFPESRQIVEEKDENFQHKGRQSRFLVARLGRSIALDT